MNNYSVLYGRAGEELYVHNNISKELLDNVIKVLLRYMQSSEYGWYYNNERRKSNTLTFIKKYI